MKVSLIFTVNLVMIALAAGCGSAGVDMCDDGETQCIGDNVERCVDGEWTTYDECAKIHMMCVVLAGKAECRKAEERDSAGDGDTDTNADTDTDTDSDSDSDF